MVIFWPARGRRSDEGQGLGRARVGPAPGPETNRYGGNTSCVQVTLSDGTILVLDAGTGIRSLGLSLAGAEPHQHPADPPAPGPHPGADVLRARVRARGPRSTIWGPAATEASLQDRIARYISAPLSPVEVRELPCDVSFRKAAEAEWKIGPATIRAELGHAPRPDARLPDHRGRRSRSATSPTTSPRSGAPLDAARGRVDLGVRARARRVPADPRLPVHGRGVPRAHGLGPLAALRHARVRAPGRRASARCCSTTTRSTATTSSTDVRAGGEHVGGDRRRPRRPRVRRRAARGRPRRPRPGVSLSSAAPVMKATGTVSPASPLQRRDPAPLLDRRARIAEQRAQVARGRVEILDDERQPPEARWGVLVLGGAAPPADARPPRGSPRRGGRRTAARRPRASGPRGGGGSRARPPVGRGRCGRGSG